MRSAGTAAVLTALLVGTGCAGPSSGAPPSLDDGDGYQGAYLDEPYRLGTATLTDTGDRPAAVPEALDAPLTLLFFGYTKCPDICQAVMADLASTEARLDPATAEAVDVLFVTTDPARDDPATLRTYLDRFDPSFEGLTGPLPTIVDLARSVHIPVEKGPRLPSGGYEVQHGTPVLGVRSDGTVPIVWTEGTSAASIAADVTALVEDEPS